MPCTKSPPKRVVTFALRWVTRMTVSAPETFASATASSGRAPKSRVTVRLTGLSGSSPGPMPQPPSAAAAAGGGRREQTERAARSYRTWKTMRLPPRRRASSRLCALSTALTSST